MSLWDSLKDALTTSKEERRQSRSKSSDGFSFGLDFGLGPNNLSAGDLGRMMLPAPQEEPDRAGHLQDFFSGAAGSNTYDPTLGGLVPDAKKFVPPADPSVAAPQAQQEDPTMAALNQLAQLAMQGSGGVDPAQAAAALAQMQGAINKTYGGQIGAIRGANHAARRDTKAGRAEVEGMYNALGQEYQKQAQRNQQQSGELSQQLKGLGTAQQQATQQAANSMNAANQAQAEAMGSQGIQAQMNADVAANIGSLADQAGRAGTNMASDALQMGGNTTRYLGTQGVNSQLEGTNRSADMLTALQDYLNQNRSKIAELSGAREAALAKAQMEQQQAVAEANANSQGDMFKQLAQVLGMKMDYSDQQQDNALAQQKAMGGGVNFASDFLKAQQNLGPDLSPIFADIMNNDAMTSGTLTSDYQKTPLNANPNVLQQYVNHVYDKKGYDVNPEQNALLMDALWQLVTQGKGMQSLPGGLG